MKNFLFILLILCGLVSVRAAIITETVEYRDRDTILQGYFAYDDSQTGLRPAVLVVHEWWGHNDYARQRARQLAEMGYIAFAVDMYGKGILTDDSQKAGELAMPFYQDRKLMQRRAKAGLEILRNHQLCDASRVAAIGFCFGGTTVLELARSGEEIKGFVSFHGGLSTPVPATPKSIKGAVLVLHGADDPYVITEDILKFQDEMRSAASDWQMVYYSGAVHSFTNPAAGDDNSKGAAYNAKAAERSWKAMQSFFKEILQ